MVKNLKDTLNLPQTAFPMRANLVEQEPKRLAQWEKMRLYQRLHDKNASRPAFILHDGPPFANGDIHVGHALNKILKDIILRYKAMRGYRTPYIPGWDCHGLPIEYQVMRQYQKKKETPDPLQLRRDCAAFSHNYIERQRTQFHRLGILTEWKQAYRTLDPAYEAEILRTFACFIEKGLIYRSKKPVYWSIPCATALAEAEIEYQEHTSPSIWVRFRITDPAFKATSIVIWTTTPWTLPANRAIAVHPKLDYSEVIYRGERFLVAKPLALTFIHDCDLQGATIAATEHPGASLEGLKTCHPFIDRPSPVVLAEYITTEAGTGCVHIAPGHGQEDYQIGLKYGFDSDCPVDAKGCYDSDGSLPEGLVGLSVLESSRGESPSNQAILKLLETHETLLKAKKRTHSYPYCWRSKTPVIFRSTDQWFVALDKDGTRADVLAAIEDVNWIPPWGKNRIHGAIKNRMDWCLSRQRYWGVPLPVFYDETGTPLLDATVVHKLADKVAGHGTDLWFTHTAETLLSGIELPEAFRGKPLTQGKDTLDVWIDSGCSHRAVLKKSLSWPADLYLEGSDQHRGWFQSSLWTAMVTEGRPPYKTVLTHGFIVGGDGKKLSKSHGTSLTVEALIKKYGVDIIRLWVSSEDYRNDVTLSESILNNVSLTYRNLRNTLRFQLSNLYDFDPAKEAVHVEELDSLDRWALHKTAELIRDVTEAYETYAFHKVYQLLSQFASTTLSAHYHDILKDRLYTLAPHSRLRRSSQTVLDQLIKVLSRLLAPILCFTADEAYAHTVAHTAFTDDSVFLQDWPEAKPEWWCPNVAHEIDTLFKFRHKINEKLEILRQEKQIGTSLDAQVKVYGNPQNPIFQLLQQYRDQLPEIFIVSSVHLMEDTTVEEPDISTAHADGVRCPRSWRWVPELEYTETWGAVSPRCKQVLESLKSQSPRQNG